MDPESLFTPEGMTVDCPIGEQLEVLLRGIGDLDRVGAHILVLVLHLDDAALGVLAGLLRGLADLLGLLVSLDGPVAPVDDNGVL